MVKSLRILDEDKLMSFLVNNLKDGFVGFPIDILETEGVISKPIKK